MSGSSKKRPRTDSGEEKVVRKKRRATSTITNANEGTMMDILTATAHEIIDEGVHEQFPVNEQKPSESTMSAEKSEFD